MRGIPHLQLGEPQESRQRLGQLRAARLIDHLLDQRSIPNEARSARSRDALSRLSSMNAELGKIEALTLHDGADPA
jgi:hypothetical protein